MWFGVGALLALAMKPQFNSYLKFETPFSGRQALSSVGLALIVFSLAVR